MQREECASCGDLRTKIGDCVITVMSLACKTRMRRERIMEKLVQPFVMDKQKFDGAVLVTGAGGCIGSWVCAILSASNIPVIALDREDDRRRASLIMGEEKAQSLEWLCCDITQAEQLFELSEKIQLQAIIHLAGLQVPFCKENPALGARVNIEGTINILELARHRNIKRTAYASSVAALALPPDQGFKETLYGVYKQANEHSAFVYWADWEVPSVGIRPNVVYGLGRDQGISAMNSHAIHAAVFGKPFDIPYTGAYSWLYAGEAAAAFIAAVSQDGHGAPIFDLNGQCAEIEKGVEIMNNLNPNAAISCSGSNFPFPANLDDIPLRRHVPDYPEISIEQGISATFEAFEHLRQQGRLTEQPAKYKGAVLGVQPRTEKLESAFTVRLRE